MDQSVELKIIGQKISPEQFKIKELTEILSNFEKLLIEIMIDQDPSLSKDNITIGLVGIDEGSVSLSLKSAFAILSAVTLISFSIQKKDFNLLPHNAIEPTKKIFNFVKNNKYDLHIIPDNKIEKTVKITPESIFEEEENELIRGNTTLYAKVERVGNISRPSVWLQIDKNNHITSHINSDMAIDIAKYLYQWIGVKGEAVWNIKTRKIVSFQIEEIGEKIRPITEAVDELSDVLNKYWKDITDVEDEVNRLRRGED